MKIGILYEKSFVKTEMNTTVNTGKISNFKKRFMKLNTYVSSSLDFTVCKERHK